jgi:hypothetical protein
MFDFDNYRFKYSGFGQRQLILDPATGLPVDQRH